MRVASHAEGFPEHAHGAQCGCGEHHSHVRVQLAQTFIGLVFIVNSFVAEWLPGFDANMIGFSAVTGAVILGFPIPKYLNPILAAVFHVAGSLLVVFNSFRLVRQGEELEPHQPPAPPAASAKTCPAADPAVHMEPAPPQPVLTA